MTEEEIFNKIADMISERFSIDRDKITKDLNFQNDLDADSIDFVELVMDLEDTLEQKFQMMTQKNYKLLVKQ